MHMLATMSQQTKRDAAEAFGNDEIASPVSTKRARRRIKHNRFKTPVAIPKNIPQQSTLPLDSTAIAQQAKSAQSTGDLETRKQHTPTTKKSLSNGSEHKGDKSNADPSSAQQASSNQSSSLTKSTHKKQTKQGKRRAKKSTSNGSKATPTVQTKSSWTESIWGGYFLDQDPLLSQDEQYILLPTQSHIHIYSSATSLLVRSLFVSPVDAVTSCVVSPSDPEQVLVSTYAGVVTEYNWMTGQKLRKWKTDPGLVRIYGLPAGNPGDSGDIIIAINHRPGGGWDLSRLNLPVSPKMQMNKVILRSQQRMATSIATLEHGKYIVGFGGDRVMLGSSKDSTSSEYTWHDFSVLGKIVSLDARIRDASITTPKAIPTVDIVVGLQDGSIRVVDDILTRLKQMGKGANDIDGISRRLHWHRMAVSAVKWSRDGNYLISGGHETVLVIWQLDTNQQQYLPHLSTSICNIVVSSSGSSYTLRLADNSVIILSTSDLLAKTNIRGVSLSKEPSKKAVAAMNPHRPNQLVLAAPSDLSLNGQSSFTTLQTFDIATGHEVSQQALVRNLTTVVNVDPHGQRILIPDVTQLQISHDGRWLATVDEWTPPDSDREPFDLHINDAISARKTEISLKFWSFQDELNSWEMITKAQDPHSTIPQSILKLASNPVRAEFISAGRDGYLRIWRPSIRQRNGLAVKNEAGEPLYTWICQHEQRPNPPWQPGLRTEAESVALAYFEDGSGIAVSFMYQDQPRILHIIDSRTGAIVDQGDQVHVCPAGSLEMTISWTRLVILSDRLLVWDVVNSMLVCHPILLKEPYVQDNGRFLAANKFDQTFAIALNPPGRLTPANVVVFDAHHSRSLKVIHVCEIHGHVKKLLPATKAPGYIVVDGQARIRRLRPVDSAIEGQRMTLGENEEAMKSLNDVFGFISKNDGVGTRPTIRLEGRPNRSIEDVLEECATSSKPMLPSELFAKVADLYKKRPGNDNEAGREHESDSSSTSANMRGPG